jgi:colanic acid biosynthesis protein WcaH
MLDSQTFKTVVENTPLISLDICLVSGGQILLGRRNNEPLKGVWFTPGGRIHKNESWRAALERIVRIELNLTLPALVPFRLMGVWDHFYPNSTCDEKISTHYVNLPHFVILQSKPSVTGDDQHIEFDWFDLIKVANGEGFHTYVREYAAYLINEGL